MWPQDGRPVLVCAGSRHPMTARQLERTRDHEDMVLLTLDPNAQRRQERLLAEIGPHLAFGHNVAITTTFSRYVEGQGGAVSGLLGRLTSMALDAFRVAGLVLTGGDVAWAVCGALQAEAIAIVGEVQPGVPAGMLLGGPHAGLRVVTKAGGFGDENAILHSIEYIQGRQVEDDR